MVWYVYAMEEGASVLYIGCTHDMGKRRRAHRAGKFANRGMLRVLSTHKTEKAALREEREMIAQYNPPLNKNHRSSKTAGKVGTPSGGKDVASQVKALRSGDHFTISNLKALGSYLTDVLIVLDEIHRRGAYVVRASTGQRSDVDFISWLRADLRLLRKGMAQRVAKANGLKGGRPKTVRVMPADQAEIIWRNVPKYQTNAHAVEHMPGWNVTAAYRAFGASGRPKTGRRKQSEK